MSDHREKKIILQRKPGRCPAVPICEHIGNLRKECVNSKGHSFFGMKDTEPCLASIVILLGESLGICIEPQQTPKDKKN
ncbi:MAG: hypothetical protein MRJ65_14940 [Candidatus Brocadiaceae bacterium]|nr:hypothetical protein [Candidatus Brocadiaceae bacterium]